MVASPATAPVSRPTNFGFFSKIQATISQVIAAKDAAVSVFRNASAVIESTRSSLPALNPYHPNHSRPVPSATSGMLCGAAVGDAPPPHIEHGGQRGDPGDGVHHDAAREVEHAPLLQQAAAPDHVDEGEVDEQQPANEEDQVGAEPHAVGERAGDQGRGDDGEHHLVREEHEVRNRWVAGAACPG